MKNGDLHKLLSPVAKTFGLDLVILFGSVASGKARADSDLDIAVLGPADLDMVEVSYRCGKALKRDGVDVSNLRTAGPTLGMAVAKGGQPIIERTPGGFAHFCSLAARKYYDAAKFRRARLEVLEEFSRRGET